MATTKKARSTGWVLGVIATILALALVAAACGDDDGGSSAGDDGGASDASESAGDDGSSAGDSDDSAGADDKGESSGGEIVTVTLRNSWIPDDLYLPLALARERGYYEEVGINLVDQIGNGGSNAAALVAAERVMIGTGEAANVVIARANGLPVVAFGTQIQEQPAGLVVRNDGSISEWADLEGKTIGGTVTSSSYATYLATAELQGVDTSAVEFQNMSPGAQLAALQAGQIDAGIAFAGNIAVLDNPDEFAFLSFAEAGFQSPSTTFFTHEDTLADNPEILEAFASATLRALSEILSDEATAQEAAEAMSSQYALVDSAEQIARLTAQRQFYLNDAVEESGLGWNSVENWQNLEQALFDGGIIDDRVDVADAFTNDIVSEIPLADR